MYVVEDFIAQGGGDIRALAIAGVGSSALGSAAFARNVAEAMKEPVAAVVSGYGLSDVMGEALGGFFWFGALNSLRHSFEGLDRATEMSPVHVPASIEATGQGLAHSSDVSGEALIRISRDTLTVASLLSDERLRFAVLTGHSKGNLVLSEALYHLVHLMPARADALAASVHIITVSAVIAMPRHFSRVTDIIGGWDWFGRFNSRLDIKPDYVVQNAWHHTNTELYAHLPVAKTLREVLS